MRQTDGARARHVARRGVAHEERRGRTESERVEPCVGRRVGRLPAVADPELDDLAWFPVGALPAPLSPGLDVVIADARAGETGLTSRAITIPSPISPASLPGNAVCTVPLNGARNCTVVMEPTSGTGVPTSKWGRNFRRIVP